MELARAIHPSHWDSSICLWRFPPPLLTYLEPCPKDLERKKCLVSWVAKKQQQRNRTNEGGNPTVTDALSAAYALSLASCP